jgi:NADPH:quinone reductase-like Zn-dependent oxidoreductase
VRQAAPQGIDAALDASGRDEEVEISVELTGRPERVLTIARFGGLPDGVIAHQGGGGGSVAVAEVVELISEGRLQVPLAATYPLEEAAAALDASEHGHHAGKIVLVTS